jgi:DNA modification methylase
MTIISRSDHLSFKGNLKHTRYGWLRLTPAYSVHLVAQMLDIDESDLTVLDPFCGIGTTALVCAEQGLECDTTDINPFLLWLARAKTRSYSLEDIENFKTASSRIIRAFLAIDDEPHLWIPPLHQIGKWWDNKTLMALARGMHEIKSIAEDFSENVVDLLKIAFCRAMIEQSNASFGHQSMSFRQEDLFIPLLHSPENDLVNKWQQSVAQIIVSASSPIIKSPRLLLCDARELTSKLQSNYYSCVFTSPPYPNRMSYVRELRPYMYWLGYLTNGKEAGELDWQAIGGTWGCATSNVAKWRPLSDLAIPFEGFNTLVERIADHSPVLSRYVHKYFFDMVIHINEIFHVVRSGGRICYIVGNSKFYDILVPVDAIFASLFEAAGFVDIDIQVVRKRSSKKELFEYAVLARKR